MYYEYVRFDPDNDDDSYFYQFRLLRGTRLHLTTTDLYSLDGINEQAGVGQENFTIDIGVLDRYPQMVGDEYYYYTFPDDGLPYYAEYTGTVEEFLASEEGRVWREEIIPMAELNQQSATVLLTDNLEYIHSFNSGEATILDGREISALEYDRGRAVCLISAAYADVNGLKVGDTIDLDFYDTGYFLTTGGVENFEGTTSEFVMTHNPLQPSNRIGFAQTYEIIGIYSAPEFEFGLQSFRADTIFVPKASVPRAENYEDPALPLLNSVVLHNGSEEDFEAYMAEQGFGGYYEYFNQDYTSTIAGLEAMELNAQRLILIGIIVVIVTAIFFYYLNMRRMIPVARTLRKLGQSRLHIWWQIQWTIQPLILLSVAAAAWLSVKLYDQVTLELLKSTVLLDQAAVKAIAKAAAMVLSIPPLRIAIPISMPKLMKRK